MTADQCAALLRLLVPRPRSTDDQPHVVPVLAARVRDAVSQCALAIAMGWVANADIQHRRPHVWGGRM
jgi:hypothetical protein